MDKQKWNPAQYAEEAHFVSELGAQVVDLLAPCAGERILDLGCGDGTLAKALHDAGCRVVGVDASPEMVAAAISTGVDARVVDGHALRFDAEFDAVFSNAALHWMTRPGLRGSTLNPDFRPFSESAFSTGAGFKAMIAKVLWWHVRNSHLQT